MITHLRKKTALCLKCCLWCLVLAGSQKIIRPTFFRAESWTALHLPQAHLLSLQPVLMSRVTGETLEHTRYWSAWFHALSWRVCGFAYSGRLGGLTSLLICFRQLTSTQWDHLFPFVGSGCASCSGTVAAHLLSLPFNLTKTTLGKQWTARRLNITQLFTI